MAKDLDLLDLGGVNREGALHADAEGDLANSEGLAVGGTVAADDVALEDLNALAVAFLDSLVDLHMGAHEELGEVLTNLLLLDSANDVH